MVLNDTIAAISTPVGEGAIAIVRTSGPRSIVMADRLFRGKNKLSAVHSHTVHHGQVVDPETGQVVDDVLVSLMKGPATYTGEDLVEINCHGGQLVTQKILQLVIRSGARLASPGEFTRRAFLNGRLDLAQAEAVVDLIRSKADVSLKVAMRQLSGGLSKDIAEIRRNLIDALALVETEIDFTDQELGIEAGDQAIVAMGGAEKIICRLLSGASIGEKLREGYTVVIVGRPNVGKSSLFNAMLQTNRAIVTEIPGTTRDTISESIELEGIPLRLVDTAGLHAGQGLVEREGVRRTRQQMSSADLLLVLLDGSESIRREDRRILKETESQRVFIVVNKIDLERVLDLKDLEKMLPSGRVFYTSAKQGDGLGDVAKAIKKELFNGHEPDVSEALVSNVRHRDALQGALENTCRARRQITASNKEELAAVDLREALSALGEITGETCNEEILDNIFSQFCVGK